MKRILGLDLGTNSIGWAVVEQDLDKREGRIIDLGSRIIPMDGAEMSNFKKGLPQTKNAKRREKKGIRVGNKRYKSRRNKLIYVLDKLDLLPEFIKVNENSFDNPLKISKVNVLPIERDTKQLTGKELFELKVKALSEPVSKEEFGRILYRFNQLRGYNGGDDNEDFEEEINDTLEINTKINKKVQESRIQIFNIIECSKTSEKKNKKDVYKIKTIDKDNNEWIGTTIIDSLKAGEQIELKQTIRYNSKNNEITSIEFSIPNKTNWRKKMEDLEKGIEDLSKEKNRKIYISEYFLYLINENKWRKIRDNVVLRSRYKEEFDKVWEIQAAEHLKNVDKSTIEEIARFLFPGKSETQEKLRNEAIDKGLKHIIKDQIIYYQRPLKDQSYLISECRFEKNEKVVAKSHPLFQEYKLWEQINKLSITKKIQTGIRKNGKPRYEYIDRPLSSKTKEKLFEELNVKKELGFANVFKLVKQYSNFKEGEDFFNGLDKKAKLSGNTTRIALKNRLGKFWNILNMQNINNQIKLWSILYNGKGNEYEINSERNKMLSDFLREFEIDKEDNFNKIVIAISTIKFKRDYANISLKAVQKSLPLIRAGKYFSSDKFDNTVNDKIIKLLNENASDPYEVSLQDYLENNEQLILEEGGFVNAYALMLLYGKHTAKEIKDDEIYKTYDKIKALKRNSLRNPLVEQIVNETLMLVKDIWKKYGKPDEIKIEFARELQNSKKEREKINESNQKAQKINENIKKRLAELKHEISNKNIEKYKLWAGQPNKDPDFLEKYESIKSEVERMKLWDEQGHIDPYTGNPISLSNLFNKGLYDVDHIIPKSRYFDDSLANKVVCSTAVNKDKGNRTAMEYFEVGSKKQKILPKEVFMDNVSKQFFGKKRKMLLATKIPDNPIERQKKETQYITIKVREKMSLIVGSKNVKTSTGGVTHYLRNHWGLTNVFKNLLKERFVKYFDKKAISEYDSLIKDNKDIKNYLIVLSKKTLTEENSNKLIDEINNIDEFDKDIFTKLYKDCFLYKDKYNNLIINGYSKRLDHRHHAIDAIIVALTNEKAIKRLNDLNKHLQDWLKKNINRFGIDYNESNDDILELFNDLDEKTRKKIISDLDKARNIETPWRGFQNEVKEKLDKIIVSHKPKDKLLIQYKEEKDDKGNIITNKKQKIIRIRGPLHEETIYGLSQNKYETYRIPLKKFASSKFDTKGNIENIVNPFLREIFKEHFYNDYKSKKSEAFNAEGILALHKKINDSLTSKKKKAGASHSPISSIKVYRKKINNKYKITLQRLERKYSHNKNLYVKTGSNYLFAVLEKEGKRIYDIITFFDAVNLLKEEFRNFKDKELFDKNAVFKKYFEKQNNADLLFMLKQLDMVYLPQENEEVITDETSPLYKEYWNDKKRFENIYTVEKFSRKQIYFLPHTNAEVIEKGIELGSQNKLEFFENRKIIKYCIPVKIDRLGSLLKIG